MGNKVIGINPTNRSSVTGKESTGWLAEDLDYPELNQVLYQAVTDHVWGTSAQVTANEADFYTDGSGNPLDKAASAVTINDDDKILIKHDATQTAALLLDAGGKRFILEMYGEVTLNMSTFALTLGGTGDEIAGSINVIGTGTLTIEKADGFRVQHTAMTVVTLAGDSVINNAVLADNFAIDWQATDLEMSLPTVATVDIDATQIQLVSNDNVIKIIKPLDLTLTMPGDLNAGTQKPSTDYETYVSANVAGTIGGKLVPILTGTTTATNSGFLVDGGQTFLDDLVLQNSIVVNNTDGISTTCSIDAAANNTFAVTDDIFTIGEEYTIYLVPTFDSGHIFFAKPGKVFNNVSSDFDNFNLTRQKKLYFKAWDQKANNTAGGSSVAGANIRALNQSEGNIDGASLSGNRVTLPIGTYLVSGSAPTYSCNAHQVYLTQDPAGTPSFPIFGTVEDSNIASAGATRSFIVDSVLVVTAPTDFEFTHWTTSAIASNGLGFNVNNTTTGAVSIFAAITFEQIG